VNDLLYLEICIMKNLDCSEQNLWNI